MLEIPDGPANLVTGNLAEAGNHLEVLSGWPSLAGRLQVAASFNMVAPSSTHEDDGRVPLGLSATRCCQLQQSAAPLEIVALGEAGIDGNRWLVW